MKAPFSPYLERLAPGMKKLIGILAEEYEYVSVLSTDSKGFQEGKVSRPLYDDDREGKRRSRL